MSIDIDLIALDAEQRSLPIAATLEITQRCNFHCKHCYLVSPYKQLDISSLLCIIEKLDKAGILILTITGGEPMLHDQFDVAYKYAKEKGFIISLLTNGLLVNKWIDVLSSYPPYVVEVSLYGASDDEYHQNTMVDGAFVRVLNNLLLLKKCGINVVAKTVATTSNIEKLGDYKTICNRLGIEFKTGWDLYPKIDGQLLNTAYRLNPDDICSRLLAGKRNEEIRDIKISVQKSTLRYKYSSIHCSSGKNSLLIDAEGYCNLCNWLRDKRINILKSDFNQAWQAIGETRKYIESIAEKSRCHSCIDRGYCNWCPVYAMLEMKDWEAQIPYFCSSAKSRRMALEQLT